MSRSDRKSGRFMNSDRLRWSKKTAPNELNDKMIPHTNTRHVFTKMQSSAVATHILLSLSYDTQDGRGDGTLGKKSEIL